MSSKGKRILPPPPLTIVTTSSSSSSSKNTSSNHREPKMNTPTILLKPSSSKTNLNNDSHKNQSLSNSTSTILSKTKTPITIPSIDEVKQHYEQNPNITQYYNMNINFTTDKDDKDVDSALLSALRDQRERMALLRLEQHLIDFMNEKHCGYMDVGGSFNNIVIKGKQYVFHTSNDNNNNSNSSSNSVNSNTDNSTDYNEIKDDINSEYPVGGGMMMTNNLNMNYVNNNNNNSNNMIDNGREGRQNSFQRLYLHRLADRFNIVRQSFVPNNINNMNNNINMMNYSSHMMMSMTSVQQQNPNLIRLIKVKESRIPKVKLIDIDLNDYNPSNSIPQDRLGSPDGAVNTITDRLNGTQLDKDTNNGSTTRNIDNNNNNNSSGLSGKRSKKKEKVKIMKRLPNPGNKNSNNSSDTEKSKRKGKKNLSDKEKAYAEARARIFNTQESSNSNLDYSDHANSITNDNTENTNEDTNSSALKIAMSEENDGSLDRQSPESQQNNIMSPDVIDEVEGASNVNVPAAAKGGAESKVLWRNRQQEASDPDFRRAHHPIMLQQPIYHQPLYQHNAGMATGTTPYLQGSYNYQGSMDPMSYNHHNVHAYYQHNDLSWQRDTNSTASMHQMQNGQYNSYSQNPYDRTLTRDEGKGGNQSQQKQPTYTDEEFPALG